MTWLDRTQNAKKKPQKTGTNNTRFNVLPELPATTIDCYIFIDSERMESIVYFGSIWTQNAES